MKLYPENVFEKFEFLTVKEWLSENCVSPMGKEIVEGLTPYSSIKNIRGHLLLTWEVMELLKNYTNFPIDGYCKISHYLNLMQKEGYTAQPEQISTVREITKTVDRLRKYIKEKEEEDIRLFKKLIHSVQFEKRIITIIDKILTPEGSVRDRASEVLAVIRNEQATTARQLEKEFNKAISQYRRLGYLASTQESVRHGRRVLAVRAEYKRKIKGIVHDISESGQTAYIEPNGCLQLSNELINLEQEERAEIARILKKLTADIQPFLPLVALYESLLGKVDFTRAKAKVGILLDGKIPQIEENLNIDLVEAYHPILKVQHEKSGKYTHPLTICLNQEQRILVISGPNAGGKSVSLKTIGLLQIMLQSGIPIPVSEQSKMGVFHNFFSEIGDDQSIENELSTYSSKLKHMSHFLDHMNSKSLFLIDEFGSGTDPSLGGAVAQSILEELNKRKAFGVITTHYLNLKTFASKTRGIENGAMLFDENTLRPLYQLEVGKPGSSYTFAIAQTSGLPQKLIHRAKKISNKDQVRLDNLLTDTQQTQSDILIQQLELNNRIKELEQKEKELIQVKKQVKQERENYQIRKKDEEIRIKAEVKKQFDAYVKKIETVQNQQKGIQDIRETLKNEIATTKGLLQSKIRKKVGGSTKKANDPISVGDRVKWIFNGEKGEVLSIRNKKAVINFGLIKSTIPLIDLVHIHEDLNQLVRKKKKLSNSRAGGQTSKLEKFDFELDIRGKRFEEAHQVLQDFFDRAILTNSSWVRILHGKGSGVLRNLTKKIARQYKAVEVKHPHPEEGGDGITIVQF